MGRVSAWILRNSSHVLFPAQRTGIDVVLLVDHLHRLAGNPGDPQLAKFAEDPGVAPTVLAGQSQNQFANVIGGPRPTGLSGGDRLLRSVGGLNVANPAQERLVADDGDRLLQLLAQLPTEPEQPAFLLRRRDQTFRQPRSQDPVLFLEVCDLPSQFLAGHGRQQGEEWVQNAAHCATVA